jgi:alcohol dehydrogenase class IV
VVRFGWGAAAGALADEVGGLGARRIFAVCGSSGRALVEGLAADLPVVAIMDEVRAHVPVALARTARSRVHTANADLVLSVGGGSATGLAKAIALSSGLPIVAVPTTYSGSEATPIWGLTDPPRKTTGTDLRVLPRAVVYDPELTLGLPRELSVTSGLNALAHCVDAMWAAQANPASTALAVEGIRLMIAGLPAVREDGTDRAGREQCLVGAYLSGAAFAGAGSGLHHKICHILGGAFDLPHAATHSVLLPHVLAFNAPAAPAVLARLTQAFGAADPVAALADLIRRLGAPTALRELGMPEEGVDAVVEQVVAAVPSGNPRPVSAEAIRALLADAWAGRAPRQEVAE